MLKVTLLPDGKTDENCYRERGVKLLKLIFFLNVNRDKSSNMFYDGLLANEKMDFHEEVT